MVQQTERIPDFSLDGIDALGQPKLFTLKDILITNKKLILYFYPKDNTPGCTVEACDFRDHFAKTPDGYVVVGVSPDSIESHKKFRAEHELNFILLSDPDHQLMAPLKVWGKKMNYGKEYEGVIRSTFLVTSDGLIEKAWRNVKAKGHVDQILKAVK